MQAHTVICKAVGFVTHAGVINLSSNWSPILTANVNPVTTNGKLAAEAKLNVVVIDADVACDMLCNSNVDASAVPAAKLPDNRIRVTLPFTHDSTLNRADDELLGTTPPKSPIK